MGSNLSFGKDTFSEGYAACEEMKLSESRLTETIG